MKKLLSLFVLMLCTLVTFAAENEPRVLNFTVDENFVHECDGWTVTANNDTKNNVKEWVHTYPYGTNVTVSAACGDATHRVVITLNGKEITPVPATDHKTYIYTFSLDEENTGENKDDTAKVVLAFKKVFDLTWVAEPHEGCAKDYYRLFYCNPDSVGIEGGIKQFAMGSKGVDGTDTDWTGVTGRGTTTDPMRRQFDEGTLIYVGGICSKHNHHRNVTVNGVDVPEEEFVDSCFKANAYQFYKFAIDQDSKIFVQFNDTCAVRVKANVLDDETDEWFVYRKGWREDDKSQVDTDDETPFVFTADKYDTIYVGGVDETDVHHVVVKLNGKLMDAEALKDKVSYDKTNHLYKFGLTPDDEDILNNDTCDVEIKFVNHYNVKYTIEGTEHADSANDCVLAQVIYGNTDRVFFEKADTIYDVNADSVITAYGYYNADQANHLEKHLVITVNGDTIPSVYGSETNTRFFQQYTFPVEGLKTYFKPDTCNVIKFAYKKFYNFNLETVQRDDYCDTLMVTVDGKVYSQAQLGDYGDKPEQRASYGYNQKYLLFNTTNDYATDNALDSATVVKVYPACVRESETHPIQFFVNGDTLAAKKDANGKTYYEITMDENKDVRVIYNAYTFNLKKHVGPCDKWNFVNKANYVKPTMVEVYGNSERNDSTWYFVTPKSMIGVEGYCDGYKYGDYEGKHHMNVYLNGDTLTSDHTTSGYYFLFNMDKNSSAQIDFLSNYNMNVTGYGLDKECNFYQVYVNGKPVSLPSENGVTVEEGSKVQVAGFCKDDLHHMNVFVCGHRLPVDSVENGSDKVPGFYDEDAKVYTFYASDRDAINDTCALSIEFRKDIKFSYNVTKFPNGVDKVYQSSGIGLAYAVIVKHNVDAAPAPEADKKAWNLIFPKTEDGKADSVYTFEEGDSIIYVMYTPWDSKKVGKYNTYATTEGKVMAADTIKSLPLLYARYNILDQITDGYVFGDSIELNNDMTITFDFLKKYNFKYAPNDTEGWYDKDCDDYAVSAKPKYATEFAALKQNETNDSCFVIEEGSEVILGAGCDNDTIHHYPFVGMRAYSNGQTGYGKFYYGDSYTQTESQKNAYYYVPDSLNEGQSGALSYKFTMGSDSIAIGKYKFVCNDYTYADEDTVYAEFSYQPKYDLSWSVVNQSGDVNCDWWTVVYRDFNGNIAYSKEHPYSETKNLYVGTPVWMSVGCDANKHHGIIKKNDKVVSSPNYFFNLDTTSVMKFVFNEPAKVYYSADNNHCDPNYDQWNVSFNSGAKQPEYQGWKSWKADKGTEISISGECTHATSHRIVVTIYDVNADVVTDSVVTELNNNEVYKYTTTADSTYVLFQFMDEYAVNVTVEGADTECDGVRVGANYKDFDYTAAGNKFAEGTLITVATMCVEGEHGMKVTVNGTQVQNTEGEGGAFQYTFPLSKATDIKVTFGGPGVGIEEVNADESNKDGKYLNKKNEVIIVRNGKQYTTAGTLLK